MKEQPEDTNKIIRNHFVLFTNNKESLISHFRRDVNENSVLRGYYAASSGNFVPTFRGII
jgi:hypothetical protein